MCLSYVSFFISGSCRKAKPKENKIFQVQTSELQALERETPLGSKEQG